MNRKGLGKGLGMGYKNLVPIDSHIHSLSARGVKLKWGAPYQKKYQVTVKCPACGKDFQRSKYFAQTYCSTKCAKARFKNPSLDAIGTLALPINYNGWFKMTERENVIGYTRGDYLVDMYFNEDTKKWYVKVNRAGMGVSITEHPSKSDATIKLKVELRRPFSEFEEIYDPIRHKLQAKGEYSDDMIKVVNKHDGRVRYVDRGDWKKSKGGMFQSIWATPNLKTESGWYIDKDDYDVVEELNAQTKLTGGTISDAEMNKLMVKEGMQDVKRFERAYTGEDKVKAISEDVVSGLKKANIPNVQDVVLDDFNSHSGQIFIKLKSKSADGNYILGDYENLPDAEKFNIRKVTDKIRKIFKDKGKDVSINNVDVPERKYQTTYGMKEFVGYDDNYIEIDYEVL